VEIPAQGSLVLAPKGTHLMFIELNHALVEGEHIPVTLHFEKGGAQQVTLVVMAMGATGPKP
jgi:copper(I)-binding protein